MRSLTPLLLLLPALVLFTGCASKPKQGPELTEAEYYRKAHKQLESKNFLTAIDQLEEIQARFPYGQYAEQVQLELIYAHYRSHDYAAAVAAADRFVRNHGGHEHLDYALYLKGLGNYYSQSGPLQRAWSTSSAARDQQSFKDAFQAFYELVSRFPESDYAPDARARMVHIRNQLAEHELHVARYYARRQAFIAAANRAQYVVQHFQGAPAVPEALAIMVKAYQELDQARLAERSHKVLTLNYPESPFLDNGDVKLEWWPGPESKGILSLLTFDLL